MFWFVFDYSLIISKFTQNIMIKKINKYFKNFLFTLDKLSVVLIQEKIIYDHQIPRLN